VRRGGTTDVELVEDDPAGPARAPRAPVRWGRVTRRWWPVPVVAAAALVLADLGTGSAEERTYAADAELPGVVQPIGPEVTSTPVGPAETVEGVGQDLDGLRVTAEWAGSGRTMRLLGRSARDGEVRWRTDLPFADLGDGRDAAVTCWTEEQLTCWAGAQGWDVASTITTGSGLVELDPATGAITLQQELAEHTVAAGDADLRVQVTGEDSPMVVTATGTDGAIRWQASVETVRAGLTGFDRVTIRLSDGVVLVTSPGGAWALSRVDGRQRGTGVDAWLSRDGRVVLLRDGRLWLVDPERGSIELGTGEPLTVTVDDGTAPQVIPVVSGSGTVTGYDATTGEVRWATDQPGWRPGTALVVHGLLIGATADAVVALDPRSGRERWRATARPNGDSELLTDGRQLLVLSGDSTQRLVGLDLRTGSELWSQELPDGGGMLFGDDGAVYRRTASGIAALS
jgi:outer membrane protein assembly factor BamB